MATQPNSDFLTSLKAAPVPIGAVEIADDSPDKMILGFWNVRQNILATIESRGSFYNSEAHSSAETADFDNLENMIPKMPALTVEGVMAKLWIAMGHCGDGWSLERRAQGDAIRRADFDEVEAFEDQLDYNAQAIFRAICDLRQWSRFESVGLDRKARRAQ